MHLQSMSIYSIKGYFSWAMQKAVDSRYLRRAWVPISPSNDRCIQQQYGQKKERPLAAPHHYISKTIIILDKTKNKNQIGDFNRLFNDKLINPKNYTVKIKHVNSVNYKGIQVADLISWSSFQAVERKNNEFIEIVENKSVKIICED